VTGVEIGRTVDLAAQESPAGEEQRQEREKKPDPERNARHEPAREEDGRRRRGRPGQPEREDFDLQRRESSPRILAVIPRSEATRAPSAICGRELANDRRARQAPSSRRR